MRPARSGPPFGVAVGALVAAVGALVAASGFVACGEGPVEPGAVGSLDPGELRILRGPDAVRSFRLAASDEPRAYLLVVQNAGRGPGSVSMLLRARGGEAEATPASLPADGSRTAAPGVRGEGAPVPVDAGTPDRLRLEERMREALRRAGARPHRPGRGDVGGRAALSATAGPAAAAGDTLRFRMAVGPGLAVDCGDTSRIARAVVRAVGERFLLAEDVEVEEGFAPLEWKGLSAAMDEAIFPVDSAYFGTPADIDGNGRVVALFTPEVNRLTSRGSPTFVAGFFWPGDLAERSSCPASNVGEILYLMAPDPRGRFSDPRSISRAKRGALQVSAHELQHLIAAQQRITLGSGTFGNLEEVWLAEGMAHVAEEVVGLRASGLGVRRDLRWRDGDPEVFATYLQTNFVRLGWHLKAPHRTTGLAVSEPDGLGSLATRGNAWLFLRWLGDRLGPEGAGEVVAGSDEARLFRELSRGGPSHLSGIANVERALRVLGNPVAWEDLVGRHAPVLALDEAGAGPSGWLPTWDLRDVFASLHAELDGEEPFRAPYPLEPTPVRMSPAASARFDLEVTAFGARYFRLESEGPAPELLLELTAPDGRPLSPSASPQVTLVRLR